MPATRWILSSAASVLSHSSPGPGILTAHCRLLGRLSPVEKASGNTTNWHPRAAAVRTYSAARPRLSSVRFVLTCNCTNPARTFIGPCSPQTSDSVLRLRKIRSKNVLVDAWFTHRKRDIDGLG